MKRVALIFFSITLGIGLLSRVLVFFFPTDLHETATGAHPLHGRHHSNEIARAHRESSGDYRHASQAIAPVEDFWEGEYFIDTDRLPEEKRPHYPQTNAELEVLEDEEVYFTALEIDEERVLPYTSDASPVTQEDDWQRQQLVERHFGNKDSLSLKVNETHFTLHAERED